MTIAKYFKNIIKRQREIGYSFPESLNRPADIKQIEEIEHTLGFQLSEHLKELYLFANGTQTKTSAHIDNNLIPLHRFLSLPDALKYYDDNIKNDFVFNKLFENWRTNRKPGKHLFPFLANDTHCYWIDLNKASENYGQLYSAINNGESPEYEFDSLIAFFAVILECYNKGIFFLDSEDKFLCSDFLRYSELCKKLNPDIEYWRIVTEN